MSKDIRKWSDGRYTLMFDEHTFFVWDNENDERMTALNVTKLLNEQQAIINKQKKRIIELEQRDYDNQSERYKILGRAIELASDYIHMNDLEYYDFCALVTELENELLEGLNE